MMASVRSKPDASGGRSSLRNPSSVPDGLAESLAGAGWSSPGDAATGLPSAGVLTALLEVIR